MGRLAGSAAGSFECSLEFGPIFCTRRTCAPIRAPTSSCSTNLPASNRSKTLQEAVSARALLWRGREGSRKPLAELHNVSLSFGMQHLERLLMMLQLFPESPTI